MIETIRLQNPENGKSLKVPALVDTLATDTVIPESLAKEIGLRTLRKTKVETAKGKMLVYESMCRLKIEKQQKIVPVIIAKNIRRVLVGVTTLETMGLALDLKRRKFLHSPLLLYCYFSNR